MDTKTILIIDHSKDAQKILKRYIEDIGKSGQFRVLSTNNGLQGLKTCREQRIDLVITELELPGMDGLKLLEARKRYTDLMKIPFFVLSKITKQEAVKKAVELGARGVFQKPINLIKLAAGICKALGADCGGLQAASKGHHAVYLSNHVVVTEIFGSFDPVHIHALKHKLMELAEYLKDSVKRFLFLIMSMEDGEIMTDRLFDLLSFYQCAEDITTENIKVISNCPKVINDLSGHERLKPVLFKGTYMGALRFLNLLPLKERTSTLKVDFIQPGTSLFASVFDERGRLIKKMGETISEDDIEFLKKNNITTIYYVEISREEEIVFEADFPDVEKISFPEHEGYLIR